MSIAYGFEPDVSPIYEDDDDLRHSVHFSSADTPKRTGRRTMGASQMEDSSQFHDFHVECVEDSVEKSITDEIVPDSTRFLEGTRIVLSAGCCLPIRHHLRKVLKEMGAELQEVPGEKTTHVIVDRYANEEIVKQAMSRRPSPPLMVDVKWIQECQDQQLRIQETDFSLFDCRYLKKRLSSFREPSPEEIEFFEMDRDGPEDPAELLEQIRKLSERIDALMNYAPTIRFEYHPPDCPTRQRPRRPKNPNLDVERILSALNTLSTTSEIKRRRSWTGFVLQHREPRNDVIKMREFQADSRETWEIPKLQKKVGKKRGKPEKVAKKPEKPSEIRKKREKIRPDDSDIQSALASLSISSPRQQFGSKKLVPLVPTKSAFINRLQMPDDVIGDVIDDDFISDVSNFRISSKNPQNRSIIFTGFSKKDAEIEKKLRAIARRFKLRICADFEAGNLMCVVSRHGKRTMAVLKAICLDLPVVRAQWLEESFEDSRLLPPIDYIHDDWKMAGNSRIFQNFPGKIFVAENCRPSREDLCWLIDKCGGKITRKLARAGLVVAPEGLENLENVDFCTPLFIVDSVAAGELQNPDDYAVFE